MDDTSGVGQICIWIPYRFVIYIISSFELDLMHESNRINGTVRSNDTLDPVSICDLYYIIFRVGSDA